MKMAQKIKIYNERDIAKMVKDEVNKQLTEVREKLFGIRMRLVDLEKMIDEKRLFTFNTTNVDKGEGI
jgi:hypothetical protein